MKLLLSFALLTAGCSSQFFNPYATVIGPTQQIAPYADARLGRGRVRRAAPVAIAAPVVVRAAGPAVVEEAAKPFNNKIHERKATLSHKFGTFMQTRLKGPPGPGAKAKMIANPAYVLGGVEPETIKNPDFYKADKQWENIKKSNQLAKIAEHAFQAAAGKEKYDAAKAAGDKMGMRMGQLDYLEGKYQTLAKYYLRKDGGIELSPAGWKNMYGPPMTNDYGESSLLTPDVDADGNLKFKEGETVPLPFPIPIQEELMGFQNREAGLLMLGFQGIKHTRSVEIQAAMQNAVRAGKMPLDAMLTPDLSRAVDELQLATQWKHVRTDNTKDVFHDDARRWDYYKEVVESQGDRVKYIIASTAYKVAQAAYDADPTRINKLKRDITRASSVFEASHMEAKMYNLLKVTDLRDYFAIYKYQAKEDISQMKYDHLIELKGMLAKGLLTEEEMKPLLEFYKKYA